MNDNLVLSRFVIEGKYECEIDLINNHHLCGYIGVFPNHPLFGLSYHDIEMDIDVHGGLTFSQGDESLNVHWFGFDCAHGGDTLEICNVDFVKGQLKKVAEQFNVFNPESKPLSERLLKIMERNYLEGLDEKTMLKAIEIIKQKEAEHE